MSKPRHKSQVRLSILPATFLLSGVTIIQDSTVSSYTVHSINIRAHLFDLCYSHLEQTTSGRGCS